MDTKSKNIKHSKGMKTAALAIAILMFFLAGNFAGLFIKGFANFNIFAHPENFTNTASFRYQMNRYIGDVVRVGKFVNIGSFEEWLESADAKAYSENYDLQKKDTEEYVKLLDSSGIKVYVDGQNRYRYTLDYKGVRYFMQYNGEFISYNQFADYDFIDIPEVEEPATAFETTVVNSDNTEITYPVTPAESENNIVYFDPYEAGGAPEYVNKVSEALLRLNGIGEYTCYGETSLEQMLAVIEESRMETLRTQYDWESSYGAHSNEVEAVKSVNFAVVFTDGTVYTNCDVTIKDSHEQIMTKLGANNLWWAEWVSNGKYEIAGPENENPSGVYATLHEALFGDYARESALTWNTWVNSDEVASAYFAINMPPEADAFGAISNSFGRYNKGTSLTGLLFATFISLAVACALCIYLLSVAGKSADDNVKIRFFDKVPVEINAVFGLAAMFAAAVAAVGIVVYEYDPLMAADLGSLRNFAISFICSAAPYSSALIGVLVAAFFMIWTGLTASCLRNIRNKSFRKHSIICWIFKPLGWIFKKIRKGAAKSVDKLKYVINCDYSKGQSTKFKVLAGIFVSAFMLATVIYYAVATACMFSWGDEEIGFILWVIGILGDAAIAVFVMLLVASLDRIMAAVSDIRKGNFSRRIDMKYMPPFMRRFAEDILSMQDGLQNAVDSAIKDQRMKAELITNVSHDLKTPLTSIVNYVDLLKKCEIEDETAQRYVSILDDKAQRMKKLIEDLVEASKASSGAMEIHPVKLNLCEFAAQAIGEHEDEMKKYGIELVLKVPETPVMVIADAQKTSRIAENLFSNIRKYALEGTRVYIDVAVGSDYGTIIFKNISKHPLDISPDELTHRFVRGDTARSGEGSGLGLSIAKDLCELQNGKLGIQIDGDLFKAIIALPKSE